MKVWRVVIDHGGGSYPTGYTWGGLDYPQRSSCKSFLYDAERDGARGHLEFAVVGEWRREPACAICNGTGRAIARSGRRVRCSQCCGLGVSS